VLAGGVMSVYLDGDLKLTGGINATLQGDATYFGLYTFEGEAWFRNIKLWNIAQP
jgi:hypothetical protein